MTQALEASVAPNPRMPPPPSAVAALARGGEGRAAGRATNRERCQAMQVLQRRLLVAAILLLSVGCTSRFRVITVVESRSLRLVSDLDSTVVGLKQTCKDGPMVRVLPCGAREFTARCF
jgi:hypothetical protein